MTRHRLRDFPVVPIRRSHFACSVGQITSTSLGRPALFEEGRFAIVTNVGRGLRWTPLARQDEARGKRTAKSCGPGLSMLRSTRSNASHCAGMVTTKPDHQGEPEGNRKTIRAGKAGVAGQTCGDLLVCFFICTRGCGCGWHPAFPAPSAFGGNKDFGSLGRNSVAGRRGRARISSSRPILRDAASWPLLRMRSSLWRESTPSW
jgi:hypothetical protein